MKMQKTKIEWTDLVWNPITGCSQKCDYCYARKIAKRFGKTEVERNFEVMWHPERLNQPQKRKQSTKIFVNSMGELFDPKVETIWIERILTEIKLCSQHIFQILTKKPERAALFNFSDNCWVGTSVTGSPSETDERIAAISRIKAGIRFLSIEPFLYPFQPLVNLDNIEWIIIGSQTNPYRPPNKSWVRQVLEKAYFERIPVFLKDNLRWATIRREWPKIIKKEEIL